MVWSMVDNLIFYSHYGNGDLFLSREFVKEIMTIIPAGNYYYAHAKNPRMFADIPNLKHTKILDSYKMRSRCAKVGNDILINTWLGTDSTFVTPANSCSILNSYKMYNLILDTLGVPQLSQPLENYIPTIDYNYFDIEPVKEFLKNNSSELVLIANCQAQSAQAENFDMTNIIQRLCDTYKDIVFIATDPVNVKAPNYITTGEITKSKDGFDLNELSYLSKFMNLFIGRSSGAQIFAMTKENCMDARKSFLSFTYRIESAHIIWEEPKIKARICWSDATEVGTVYSTICTVLETSRKKSQ